MLKTNKALAKRIKVTGTKKFLRRPSGQNHFNAKDTGSYGRRKKGFLKLEGVPAKKLSRRLSLS